MSITPSDLLAHAQSLLGNHEPSNRSAASRAYYAAYHECQAVFKTVVCAETEKSGMHNKFITGMTRSPNKQDKMIGYILRDNYQLRLSADYNLESDFSEKKANQAVKQSERLMGMVQAYNPEPSP